MFENYKPLVNEFKDINAFFFFFFFFTMIGILRTVAK